MEVVTDLLHQAWAWVALLAGAVLVDTRSRIAALERFAIRESEFARFAKGNNDRLDRIEKKVDQLLSSE